jgi:hypothetical protein
MDLKDVVRNTLFGTILGHAVGQYPIPEKPTEQAIQSVENTQDAALFFDVTPSPEFDPVAVNADQEPTPAALSRGERAKEQWLKIAELPSEPGVYKMYDRESRRICAIVVYPANKAESRMEYGIHCGVDTTPKAER